MSFLLVSELPGLQISKYANIGGFAILIFDYCITFHDEVQWTWSRSWDIARVIFVISRYLPFIGAGMTAYDALRVSGPCPPTLEENIIHILCIIAAEGLLLLRVWAFWKRSRRVLVGLLCCGLLTIVAAVAVPNISQPVPGQTSSLSSSIGPVISGPAAECPFETSRTGAVVYSFLAGYEIVILLLTVYKRFYDYRDYKDSFINIVYLDGMAYMSCIIAITVTNVIVAAAFPSAYSNMFETLQIVIHSVLASRILFHLRSSNDKVYEVPIVSLTSMRYELPLNSRTTGTESVA